MGLTESQSNAALQIGRLLRTKRRAILNGSAGVGKTYLANEIIKQMSRSIGSHQKIYVSAPTNKAVAVIKDKVTKAGNMEFVTTHSALKMKRQIDKKTGEVKFVSYANEKYPPLDKVKLLVIDEASMINKYMLDKIEEYASRQGTMVLFIGDDKQLPPVNEVISPVFDSEYNTVTLTEIIRQNADNPIITLSRNLSLMQSKDNNRNDVGGYIFTQDISKIVATLAEVNGSDELKYLAWTNAEINRVNAAVRRFLYGHPKLVEKGESLIFNSPFGRTLEGASLFYTNEEITVDELDVISRDIKYPVKSNKVTDEFELNTVHLKMYSVNAGVKELKEGVLIIHEDSLDDYKKILTKMRSNCMARVLEWTDYFAFQERFADIKYNHAITVHKSQGSTYRQSIINVKDLNRNRKKEEKEKLFYTAVTRASDLVILYNV